MTEGVQPATAGHN